MSDIPSPHGAQYVYLVDPASNTLVAPVGALGRFTAPNGDSFLIRKKLFNVAASQTDSVLIAAVDGYTVCVLATNLQAGGTATNVTFGSKLAAGTTTALSPLIALAANGGHKFDQASDPWFSTVPSEGLVVTTGAGATTGGVVKYVQIPNDALLLPDGSPLYGDDGQVITIS